jgi:hypothetical protein
MKEQCPRPSEKGDDPVAFGIRREGLRLEM